MLSCDVIFVILFVDMLQMHISHTNCFLSFCLCRFAKQNTLVQIFSTFLTNFEKCKFGAKYWSIVSQPRGVTRCKSTLPLGVQFGAFIQ